MRFRIACEVDRIAVEANLTLKILKERVERDRVTEKERETRDERRERERCVAGFGRSRRV